MRKTLPTALPAQAAAQTDKDFNQEDTGVYIDDLASQTRPSEEETNKREHSLALLRSVADIGDEAEQQETFFCLQAAIDADRLSERKRFAKEP